MTPTAIDRACCLGFVSTQLPNGLAADAVAIPASLGESVLHTLDALFPFEAATAVLEDLTHSRTYLFTEPGQGGVWGDDVWTLDAGTWLVTPHSLSGSCDDLKVWRHWQDDGGRLLPVTDLRRALRLAYPAFRWRTAGRLAQQMPPGGFL